jgi:hypothetical protein
MTEAEADRLAARRNHQLGLAGEDDRFFVPVQDPDGGWRVEERHETKGRLARLFDAMPGLPW